jgi:hypothetical protein
VLRATSNLRGSPALLIRLSALPLELRSDNLSTNSPVVRYDVSANKATLALVKRGRGRVAPDG